MFFSPSSNKKFFSKAILFLSYFVAINMSFCEWRKAYAISPAPLPADVPPSFSDENVDTSGESPLKKLLLDTRKARSDTIAFYKENNYQPVWILNGVLNPAGKIALEVLERAAIEGLNPADYTETKTAISKGASPEEIDIALTSDMIRFIDDLRVGRIPPSHTARIIKITSPKTNPVHLLQEALKAPEQLHHLAPEIADYQSLKQALAFYRQLYSQSLTDPKKKLPKIAEKILKVGDKKKEVSYLRQLLHLLGDSKLNDLTSITFDKEVEEAVKRFQKRHFIEPTGVVSDLTRTALNMPLTKRIDTIIINMERLRWLPDDHLTTRYLLVNVAGYEVKAYTNNRLDFRMKAIVGKTSTKTPLFYAPLKNIVINPSWGVPHSIFLRDKLSKILQDPGYVQRGKFTIYDENNQVINPDEADWANEGKHYRLRQSPGPHNALGRIKFNIENPYTIYLHGTPDEKLFNKLVRNYSSGCIRLHNPIAMAHWILNKPDDYSIPEIEKLIKKGETLSLKSEDQINVYFTYQTAWVGDEGEHYFSPDAYKLDAVLEKLLKAQLKNIEIPETSKIRIT